MIRQDPTHKWGCSFNNNLIRYGNNLVITNKIDIPIYLKN